ncbi:hypothetical protein M409DRAFT_68380 [Zasmidium cellare ATCC 36951]|uniref:Cupin type-2 domain-containing protein n=1 Tax=Zasmidium cellare ATCC 36951 TaxID=1080233 RepID=A0A6A6C9A9_ZASCE|nr:uncharacterized protein M409DRAFT_68380 [Zasmidium cellare ATCC 36951]KAF2163413.1 hypothetical protein M409DRAFT_68380 [Zasmidium cellare ATCC 36951]
MGNRASKLKRRTAEDQKHKTKPVFLTRSEINQKPSESFPDASKGRLIWTTLLSSGLTASEKLTAGIATCPPSVGFLGHHRHEQAELYFILEGEGLMKVDDVERRVERGGLVFIPGNAEHGISNLSGEKDLVWLYCFPTDRFEDVVYKFSNEWRVGYR